MIGRITILHILLASLLFGGYYTGLLPLLWEFDHVYALPVVGLLIGLGSLLAAFSRWEWEEWLAERLPAVGLLFTVLGMITQVGPLLEGDIASVAAAIMKAAIGASVGTFIGMAGWLWLGLVKRVCHD